MRMFARPRWVITHLAVLAVVVAFVNLGFWQLRRLEERRSEIETITRNMAAEVEPLERVLDRSAGDPASLANRRVTVTGRYRPDEEVLLTPRSNGREAGHHVLTPLVISPDEAVLVNRGWVPFSEDEPPIDVAAPVSGEVTVTGLLFPTQAAARFGTSTGGKRLTYLSTADVDRIQPQVDVALLRFSVLLQEQEPAPVDLPVPGTPPEVSEGSHQSYAWQWFSFATILAVGYPLLLRRSLAAARQRERAVQPDVD